MLDTSARYVYKVYTAKSVSKAAKELYISQPALSAAIRRAEQELGAPIFNRKTLPFTLTPAGKVYMEAVEQVRRIEKQMEERIRGIREVKKGTLRIGTGKHLSYFVVPAILKHFHAQYPQVDVHIELAATNRLYELLEKEIVDMLFIPEDSPPDSVTAVPLFKERLVVAVRRDMVSPQLTAQYGLTYSELVERRYGAEKMITDMSLLSKLDFVYTPPETGIYQKRRLLLHDADVQPYAVTNSTSMQFYYNLMLAGVGAHLTTDVSIATLPPNDECVFFALDGEGTVQDFCMVYPSDAPSAVRDAFIAVARDHFSEDASIATLLTV